MIVRNYFTQPSTQQFWLSSLLSSKQVFVNITTSTNWFITLNTNYREINLPDGIHSQDWTEWIIINSAQSAVTDRHILKHLTFHIVLSCNCCFILSFTLSCSPTHYTHSIPYVVYDTNQGKTSSGIIFSLPTTRWNSFVGMNWMDNYQFGPEVKRKNLYVGCVAYTSTVTLPAEHPT